MEGDASLHEKIIREEQEYPKLLQRDSEQKFDHLELKIVKLQSNNKRLETKLENYEVL